MIESSGGRLFATHPAAVVVPIVNEREELLLLESPRRTGWWEPVNGAVDADETLLGAALREVREEVGAGLRARPLGVVHASTFAYDARLRYVISVTYLMAHERGDPVPGDDMRGSRVRWANLTRSSRRHYGSCRRSTSPGFGNGQSSSSDCGSPHRTSRFKAG